MALLARLKAALLQINDTSYDVFDNICFNHTAPHVNATIVINGSNDTNASNATNATNGTSAPPGSDRLAPATVGSGSTEATGVGALQVQAQEEVAHVVHVTHDEADLLSVVKAAHN